MQRPPYKNKQRELQQIIVAVHRAAVSSRFHKGRKTREKKKKKKKSCILHPTIHSLQRPSSRASNVLSDDCVNYRTCLHACRCSTTWLYRSEGGPEPVSKMRSDAFARQKHCASSLEQYCRVLTLCGQTWDPKLCPLYNQVGFDDLLNRETNLPEILHLSSHC